MDTTTALNQIVAEAHRWAAMAKEARAEAARLRREMKKQAKKIPARKIERIVTKPAATRIAARVSERAGEAARIGRDLLECVDKMFDWWYRVRDGTLARSSFQEYMKPLRRRVRALLEEGKSCGHAKTAGTCREILKLEPALWTFVRVPGVEPTNNAAERAIRPGVLWRKGSFGTHSAAGSRFVERMMTVAATLKQQKRNIIDYLTQAADAALHGRPAPSLLPIAVVAGIPHFDRTAA